MINYQQKLYAFLQACQPHSNESLPEHFRTLRCWGSQLHTLEAWWQQGEISQRVATSSDRVNLQTQANLSNSVEVRHPISGQQQTITEPTEAIEIPPDIQGSPNAEQVFWWFWRFYPEYLAKANPDAQALLCPAHRILPDCPLHSYQSTVSALAGAMFPEGHSGDHPETPYLLLFSFSPVQEFIKASRKFVDFWAGSYLLHYLSARLCWYVAQEYGPDAVIVPSLWNQEIFDALMLQDDGFSSFEEYFRAIAPHELAYKNPAKRFEARESNSLSTAGFPNMITVLVPGKAAAEELGQELADKLAEEWQTISGEIRNDIRQTVIAFLTDDQHQTLRDELWQAFEPTLPQPADPELYRQEMELLKQQNCWEWRHLWEAQIDNTWEPYWAAVPLGHPGRPLIETDRANYAEWAREQDAIAWPPTELPTEAEKRVYTQELNVGTWWGSLQQRLRTAHMAVKNTRHWQIPAAPGPRSSLSGQFSAVHPRLNYQKLRRNGQDKDFREGGGLPDSSMRLFWLIMAYAYKGLFNGSEMLNALELTKRMAWQFGGVADSMGINVEQEKYSKRLILDDQNELNLEITEETEIDYEKLIRFPNLSSIAAARFMYETGGAGDSRLKVYWRSLRHHIAQSFTNREHRNAFGARTRGRPTQVPKTDQQINQAQQDGCDYNGVMFSAKWLADEMNLEKARGDTAKIDEVRLLRQAIDAAHKDADFGDGSPGDWWVIVLGDGDGMGRYISGETLHNYGEYIVTDAVDQAAPSFDAQAFQSLLNDTQKRMGPATHIGLNRALLDFSNRLVPYLTEKRYCGRVIYSGGDDVMAVLPLEDLPGYLRSLRAAWSGKPDPEGEFNSDGGYWHPKDSLEGLSQRPHFTMGKDATMSLGIVIANKAVPLPTVLEHLWEAEKTAKAMPGKDGLCFRVIYGGGNTLEALMKGRLLDDWWALINHGGEELSPLLYRLAEELPKRASLTDYYLFAEAAKVIAKNRDESRQTPNFDQFCTDLDRWLRDWEDWARAAVDHAPPGIHPTGTRPEDLGYLLRFSAFWVSKNAQRRAWVQPVEVRR